MLFVSYCKLFKMCAEHLLPTTDKSVALPPTMRSAGFRCALGARVSKKIPVNKGGKSDGGNRNDRSDRGNKNLCLSCSSCLSCFSSRALRARSRLTVSGWHLPCCCLLGDLVALFSLPLLVAKVAQKPRTTSLAETRVAKPKTNATQAKRLPSSFLNGFATLVSRDRNRSLTRRRCEVRVLGAPTAQVSKKIPVNKGVERG